MSSYLNISGFHLTLDRFKLLIKSNVKNVNDYDINNLFFKFDDNGDSIIDFNEFQKNISEIARNTQENIIKFEPFIERLVNMID